MNILLLALALLAFQSAAAGTLPGRVVGIADGDTLTVLDENNKPHKIRLSGIDAPETTAVSFLLTGESGTNIGAS